MNSNSTSRMGNQQRRHFLKCAGVTLALPVMESLVSERTHSQAASDTRSVKRMVVFSNAFGMYPSAFFPEEVGTDYRMPELLQPLERHRRDMTVFSNLDHGLNVGHAGTPTLLNGIESKNARYYSDGNISVDQRAAEWLKATTRFPSLQTSVRGAKNSLSWKRNAVNLHGIGCKQLYDKLFLNLDEEGRVQQDQRYDQEASILDVVLVQAKTVHDKLGKNDQHKLDEYLNSVRSLEKRFAQESQWLHKNKPQTLLPVPLDRFESIGDEYDAHMELLALALQTDSTRIITTDFGMQPGDHDLSLIYHAYSHHGELPDLVNGLIAIEKHQMECVARFLDRLKETEDSLNGGTLLDHTMVLFGCGMATGHHSNRNLPVFLAGGGFKHGRHYASPADKTIKIPLCNLLLLMLQNFGVEADQFGTSTGTFTGLELV